VLYDLLAAAILAAPIIYLAYGVTKMSAAFDALTAAVASLTTVVGDVVAMPVGTSDAALEPVTTAVTAATASLQTLLPAPPPAG
jgi:hypothetical protein